MDPSGADQRQFRRMLSRAVAVPLALALLLGAILLLEVIYLLRLQRWVEQTDRAIEQSYAVEQTLLDMQTGVRGYMLTGDSSYFETYLQAQPRLPAELATLEEQLADKLEQVQRVRRTRDLHAEWERMMAAVLAAFESGADPKAVATLRETRQHMEQMRSELQALRSTQQQLRAQRVQTSQRAAQIVLASAAGLSLLLGAALALMTRRRLVSVSRSYRQSLETIDRQNASLRQSEDRYRRLVELSPIGVLVQTEGRIVYANRALRELLGADGSEQIIGRPVLEIVHPDYRDAVRERVRRLHEQQQDAPLLEEQFIRLDGTPVWVEVTATPFAVEGKPGAQVLVRDISKDVKARQSLRRSEAQLAKAQAIAHLGSWEWDLRTNQVSWSEEMYRIFGLEPTTPPLQYENFQTLVHAEDRARVVQAIDSAILSGQSFNVDYRVVLGDGTERYLQAQGEAACDAGGKPNRFFGTVLDITERKRAEEALRQLNEKLEQLVADRTAELRAAVEDLEAFSYTISHDLRTPLRGMQGFAQALLEDYGDKLDANGTDYARRIVAATVRMDQLTQEILEYSRLSRQDMPLQRISLVLLLHEVIGQLQRDPQFAQANVTVREPMPWVLAHRATLSTVLMNLLSNAAKFVAPHVVPQIEVYSEDRPDDKTRIWVIDNGIGIPFQHHERIFDVFERLHGLDKYPGTGIGLATVRRGVERMGGRVGVESAVGRGSRFWVELIRDPESP